MVSTWLVQLILWAFWTVEFQKRLIGMRSWAVKGLFRWVGVQGWNADDGVPLKWQLSQSLKLATVYLTRAVSWGMLGALVLHISGKLSSFGIPYLNRTVKWDIQGQVSAPGAETARSQATLNVCSEEQRISSPRLLLSLTDSLPFTSRSHSQTLHTLIISTFTQYVCDNVQQSNIYTLHDFKHL